MLVVDLGIEIIIITTIFLVFVTVGFATGQKLFFRWGGTGRGDFGHVLQKFHNGEIER